MEIYLVGGIMVGYVLGCVVCHFVYANDKVAFLSEIDNYKTQLKKYVPKRDVGTGKFIKKQ